MRVLDTPGLLEPCGISLSLDEKRLVIVCTPSHCVQVFSVDGSEAPRTFGGNLCVPEPTPEPVGERGQLRLPCGPAGAIAYRGAVAANKQREAEWLQREEEWRQREAEWRQRDADRNEQGQTSMCDRAAVAPQPVTPVPVGKDPDQLRRSELSGADAKHGKPCEKGSGDGQFMSPKDARFTQDGRHIVVADGENKRLQILLSVNGCHVRNVPLRQAVCAVAVDAAGNMIASTSKQLTVFSPEGRCLHAKMAMGDCSSAGLSIDPSSGRIAIGDHGAGRVHLF